jgi:hypothetical protein
VALLGCFFSGESERGGVVALEARLPLSISLCKMVSFCGLLSIRYVIALKQQAIPSHMKFASFGMMIVFESGLQVADVRNYRTEIFVSVREE